jgi:hypothetical protein
VRRRQQLGISLVTGQAVVITETVDGDATVAERVAQLKVKAAAALGRDPAEVATIAVCCDGCPEVTRIDYDADELPPGWTANATGEFCPACAWRQAD